jgi:hypothetical protein
MFYFFQMKWMFSPMAIRTIAKLSHVHVRRNLAKFSAMQDQTVFQNRNDAFAKLFKEELECSL